MSKQNEYVVFYRTSKPGKDYVKITGSKDKASALHSMHAVHPELEVLSIYKKVW